MKKRITKTKILLRQNLHALLLILFWFFINFIIISILTQGNYMNALLIVFFFQELPGPYGVFYPTISEIVIFGIIFSFIITEFYRKYDPRQTSLELARSLRDHTIIIGYSHLGIQIRNYLMKHNKACVVMEPDEDLVTELLDEECPVILKHALDIAALKDAGVKYAKLVVMTRNDLETLIVASGYIRDLNKKCKIICRCFDDSIADVLEKTYNCVTISSSKYASEFIMDEIKEKPIENVIIVGYINIAKRLIKNFKTQGIKYNIIERDEIKIQDILDDEPVIIGDAKDEDNLKKAGIGNSDLFIVLVDNANEVVVIADKVKELNENCKLICRFFHEDVSEILGKPPFNAIVISQSRHTLDHLIKDGAFVY